MFRRPPSKINVCLQWFHTTCLYIYIHVYTYIEKAIGSRQQLSPSFEAEVAWLELSHPDFCRVFRFPLPPLALMSDGITSISVHPGTGEREREKEKDWRASSFPSPLGERAGRLLVFIKEKAVPHWISERKKAGYLIFVVYISSFR